jgi:hypothetical protein
LASVPTQRSPSRCGKFEKLVIVLLESAEKAEDLWEKLEATGPDFAEMIKKSERDARID